MATENYGRLKLLFVDDAAHTRLMLREMLRKTDWSQVEFADSAAAAFKQIKANLPDLVITDWQMPGESGLDLIRAIRERPDSPDRLLPVILLTASGDAEHVLGARKAGATDFLVKPISMNRIVERVINAVTRPRPFIVSPTYKGPDWRRAGHSGRWQGRRSGPTAGGQHRAAAGRAVAGEGPRRSGGNPRGQATPRREYRHRLGGVRHGSGRRRRVVSASRGQWAFAHGH